MSTTTPTLHRAYSTLAIKAMDDESRRFTGIASTISTDRMGDVVEPKGARFKLPLPLLWQHNHRDPIGWIRKATVGDTAITIEGEVANVPEADSPTLHERLREAWAYLKNGLVRGLSIGFSSIEHTYIDGTYGVHFREWEWLELSAVTIPANQDASITAIKSIDRQLRAASGHVRNGAVRLIAPPPGASGPIPPHDVRALHELQQRGAVPLIPRTK